MQEYAGVRPPTYHEWPLGQGQVCIHDTCKMLRYFIKVFYRPHVEPNDTLLFVKYLQLTHNTHIHPLSASCSILELFWILLKEKPG